MVCAGADVEGVVIRLRFGSELGTSVGATDSGRPGVSLSGGRFDPGQLGLECLPAATRAGDQQCIHAGAGVGAEHGHGRFRTRGPGFNAGAWSGFAGSHGYRNQAAPGTGATAAANPAVAKSL